MSLSIMFSRFIHMVANGLPSLSRLNNSPGCVYKFFSHCSGSQKSDQDVSRVDFFCGLSAWLVDGCLLPVSSHSLSSVPVCVQMSSSSEDTSHIGLGSTLMTSFYIADLFNDPLSTYSHILK